MDNKKKKKALEDRFTLIYNQYKSSIYKFCLVKLNGDNSGAEDCMQNVFMTFYRKLRNNEEITNPRAYLYKIAGNYIMKHIEANAKQNNTILPLEDYTDKVVDDRDSVDSRIDYQILNEKLNKLLTPNEQQLLQLKYIDDLTIEQVAKVLGVNKQTVAKRLQRLRDKIKNSIVIE